MDRTQPRHGNIDGASFNAVQRLDGLEIDFSSRRITMDGVPLDLRAMEYDLLAFFALHPHQLFSRSELLELVWHSNSDWQKESTVTEHVYRVRVKITRRGERNTIVTIRNGGYRFDPTAPRDGGTVPVDQVGRKTFRAPALDQISLAQGEHVVVTMLRALLRIGSAEDAVELLQLSVRQLGGTVLAARHAGADALSIDVTLGVGAPMRAVAEPHSVSRLLLERFLPALAEDARNAVNLLERSPQPTHSSAVTGVGEATTAINPDKFEAANATLFREGRRDVAQGAPPGSNRNRNDRRARELPVSRQAVR